MAKHSFSRSVLRGAISSGFSAVEFAGATKLTPAQVRTMRAGGLELTSRQKKSVEKMTGKTCGQLAALDLEPNGGEFTELMDGWADVARSFARRRAATKRRVRR